jgi:hypothetical protein
MTNCCPNNNCVEIVPSGCVKYTGTPTSGGLIDSFDSCDPYLNDLLKLLDDNVTLLDARVGLNKSTFDAANTACGTSPVISTTGLTVKDDKYYSAEVVIKLVGVICELRSRMNYLTQKDINVNSGNLHWLDLPLDTPFKTWLADQCLGDDPCSGNEIQNLRGLFQAIITKLCNCCA